MVRQIIVTKSMTAKWHWCTASVLATVACPSRLTMLPELLRSTMCSPTLLDLAQVTVTAPNPRATIVARTTSQASNPSTTVIFSQTAATDADNYQQQQQQQEEEETPTTATKEQTIVTLPCVHSNNQPDENRKEQDPRTRKVGNTTGKRRKRQNWRKQKTEKEKTKNNSNKKRKMNITAYKQ